MPDLEEDSSISNQVLQPNKWTKSKFWWRMDIDVELFENFHDTVDDNTEAEESMNANKEDDDDNDSDAGESLLDYGTDSDDSESRISSNSNSNSD